MTTDPTTDPAPTVREALAEVLARFPQRQGYTIPDPAARASWRQLDRWRTALAAEPAPDLAGDRAPVPRDEPCGHTDLAADLERIYGHPSVERVSLSAPTPYSVEIRALMTTGIETTAIEPTLREAVDLITGALRALDALGAQS